MLSTALLAAFALGCPAEDTHGDHHHHDDTAVADEARELTTESGSYLVSYMPDPDPIPMNDYFDLMVHVHDGADTSAPVTDAVVTVDATMPAHGHGMNTQAGVTSNGDGTYRVDGMLFHMEGLWEIEVIVDDAAGVDKVVFEVDCCE